MLITPPPVVEDKFEKITDLDELLLNPIKRKTPYSEEQLKKHAEIYASHYPTIHNEVRYS